MFVPAMPPELPSQYAPVIIAQAAPAEQATRTLGRCQLIENPPSPPGTAVNSLSPQLDVTIYFKWFEQRDVGLEGKVTLLQGAVHGELIDHGTLIKRHGVLIDLGERNYSYKPSADYHGPDHATFLVDIRGYKVEVHYVFNVLPHVPGGTEGYDPYEDKTLCPNGRFWKISADGGVIPLPRQDLDEENSDKQSLAPTVQWTSGIIRREAL